MNVDRPIPSQNRQADRRYAEAYAASHRAAGETLDARLAIEDLILLDGLLRDYRLLDVGCATGGYLRFLRNHQHVTGLDYSSTTIEQARELQIEFGIERVEYVVSKFEEFDAGGDKFDAVRLRGTFGAYQPWPSSIDAIDKTSSLLNNGGIAIASHFEPPTIAHKLKAAALPNHTLSISQKKYSRLWLDHDFDFMFDIRLPTCVVTFWRKL